MSSCMSIALLLLSLLWLFCFCHAHLIYIYILMSALAEQRVSHLILMYCQTHLKVSFSSVFMGFHGNLGFHKGGHCKFCSHRNWYESDSLPATPTWGRTAFLFKKQHQMSGKVTYVLLPRKGSGKCPRRSQTASEMVTSVFWPVCRVRL